MIGGVVVLRGRVAQYNGADECPAIITRVYSRTLVNVTAFPDDSQPRPVLAVPLFFDRTALEDANLPHLAVGAYWPPRV